MIDNPQSAKDIEDGVLLHCIDKIQQTTHRAAVLNKYPDKYDHSLWQFFNEDAPYKVIKAKLQKLIKQGYVTGCVCGCKGDFELTPKAYIDYGHVIGKVIL